MQLTEHRTIRRRSVVLLCAAAFFVSLWYAAGTAAGPDGPTGMYVVLTAITAVSELLLVLAVMVAAGGWGHLAIGWLTRGTGVPPVSRMGVSPMQPLPLDQTSTSQPNANETATPYAEHGRDAHATHGRDARATPLVTPGLVVVTSILAGYWLIAVALLAVGSFTTGGLTSYIWWPVVGVGVVLAVFQGRRQLNVLSLPPLFDGRFLHWIVLAVAAGAWVAGAAMPPSLGLGGDGYDVLLYHLQLPREYLHNQHIAGLEHNVYSHYPLGQEMLYLLMMILRGGAYNGMYAAQFSHGIFAVLAVAAVFSALRPADDRRARYAMLLLATTPFVLYLSWMAFAELAEILALTLALLWLRVWILSTSTGSGIRDPGSVKTENDQPSAMALPADPGSRIPDPVAPRATAIIGLCLGVACCAKYLSVGMIVLPVLAAMLGLAVLRRPARAMGRRLIHVLLAGLVALVVFSPWLIRNAATVGNPVFPLATAELGKGHWTDEQQQRWIAGHGPDKQPPVPAPPDYRPSPPSDRPTMLFHHFFINPLWGQITMLLFLVAAGELISRGRRGDPWDWSLLTVAGVLLVVWVFATHEMPDRFAVPVVVPMTLLAAGFLSRLARVETNPLKRDAAPPKSGLPWGLAPAAVLLVMAMFVNLATVGLRGDERPQTGGVFYRAVTSSSSFHPPGTPGQSRTTAAGLTAIVKRLGADVEFPSDAVYGKFLTVGGAPFYQNDGSLYATPFDTPPLLALAGEGTPAERLERLRQAGVQYIGVEWLDLQRLAYSYGLPEPLFTEMARRQSAGLEPALPQLEALQPLGVTERHFHRPAANGETAIYYTLYTMPWAKFTHWPEENAGSGIRHPGSGDTEDD